MEDEMKHVKRIFGVVSLFLLLGVANPVKAQSTDRTTTTETTTNDDDDNGKWGLAGLLGLLGLLGLRKRDDDRDRRTTTVNR